MGRGRDPHLRRLLGAVVLTTVAALSVTATAGNSPGAAGGRIAFWNDHPRPSLWLISRENAQPTRILGTTQNAKRPRFSPDGRWVAFDGAPPPKPAMSDFDIQVVRLDGTSRRTLTSSPQWDIDAQWSPDGTLLAFQRMPAGAVWQKAWIWTIRPDGSGLRRLTRGGGARWSPDGSRLVVHSPTKTSAADLFVVRRDGGGRRLLLASPQIDQPAGWSPHGDLILFTRYDDAGRAAVYVIGVDGTTGLRKLADGVAGAWSPDGREIVYTAADPGQLMVMRADGTGKRRLRGAFGAEPDWR
jgi:Tol biopolymer transport system component